MQDDLSKAIDTYSFLDPDQKQALKLTLESVISQFAVCAKELERLADVYTKAWRIHTDVARGFKRVAELGKVQRVVGGDALTLIAYRGTPQQIIYNSVFGKIPILEQQCTEQTADEAAGDSREASPKQNGLVSGPKK